MSEPLSMTLFLAGDVMTGRGIDQVLPSSVGPRLHEPYVKDARRYVRLAEEAGGEIPAPVPHEYVWGDALAELDRVRPHARLVNLETAVTAGGTPWPRKGIHYRMHPDNVPVLTAAGVDACVMANNHAMDWGRPALRETLEALRSHGLAPVGAGAGIAEAEAPAVVTTEAGRLLVFAWATPGAGVPPAWAATEHRSGVSLLTSLGPAKAQSVLRAVEARREAGDRVVVSIHWGPNWGYDVAPDHRAFAHRLLDSGAVDLVFGHSSHHPRAVEVYRDRAIIYGAGDFLNDYEGIGGRERYRSELTLMYFPTLDPDGALTGLRLTPMRIRGFRLQRADPGETDWLADTLDRHSRTLGTRVERAGEQLRVVW